MKNKLQHKLYNYQVSPPPGAWDRIAASLDESHLSESFPSILYNFEKIPPASTWEKISGELFINKEAPKPLFRKLTPFIRYASAAILIGIIAFTAILLINSGNKNVTTAKTENNILNRPKENTKNEINSPDTGADELQQERDDAALEASKQIIAKLDIPQKKRLVPANTEFITSPIAITRNLYYHNPEDTYRDIYYNSIQSTIHLEADKYNIDDRYTMLMTPEGKIIRLAKKWSELLCCVAGEDPNKDCTDQLMKWRTKIACAPLAPSPGNFLDILSLVNSLKEN